MSPFTLLQFIIRTYVAHLKQFCFMVFVYDPQICSFKFLLTRVAIHFVWSSRSSQSAGTCEFPELVLARMTLLMDESRAILPLWSSKAREFGELWREKVNARAVDLSTESVQNQFFSAGQNGQNGKRPKRSLID